MELRDYVRLLRRRWWVVVLCMVLGAAGAYAATSRQPKVYGSQVTFFLSDAQGRPVNSLIAEGSQSRFTSYSTLLGSAPVAELVQQREQLAFGYGVSGAGVPNTIFFRLATTAATPEQALLAAQAYSRVFPDYITRFEGGKTDGVTSLRVLEAPRLNPSLISPNPRRNEEVGLGLGLLVALGVLLLLEALDNKVRDVAELERVTDVGVAAAVPQEFRGEHLLTDRRPRSQRAEAVRLIRTNVQFAGIGADLRTLVVTSPGAGEGKTSIATDLAVAYAQSGQRVILVDADLRKPRVGLVFEMEDTPGLTNVLVGEVAVASALRPWGDGYLQVLTSGTRPAKPSELLGSTTMGDLVTELRELADLVIIDSAPVMPVADTTALLAHVDAVLVVVRVGATTRGHLKATVSRLQSVDTRIVGLVANGGRSANGEGYYTDSARRGLRRRHADQKLLEVPVEVVAGTEVIAAPAPSAPAAQPAEAVVRSAAAPAPPATPRHRRPRPSVTATAPVSHAAEPPAPDPLTDSLSSFATASEQSFSPHPPSAALGEDPTEPRGPSVL